MKILTAKQLKETDAATIQHQGITSPELMERAAEQCVEWLEKNISIDHKIKIVCGQGNNGGDGLAIARLLIEKQYNIELSVVRYSEKCSEDFLANEDKILEDEITDILDICTPEQLDIEKGSNEKIILIDAIFGTGLNKPVEGFVAEVIEKMNVSGYPIIAIDIPSGLFADDNTGNKGKIIKAGHTLSFQMPKLSFMFADNFQYVGDFSILDIGLDERSIEQQSTNNYFITEEIAKTIYTPRQKFSHKGTCGHALLVAGSYGKMGAAVLAAKAGLRAGAGLITTHVPKCGYEIIQTSVPEAMVNIDSNEHFLTDNIHLESFNAIGVGPGLGTEKQSQNILKLLIQNSQNPIVLDADALNILSENKTWISFLKAESILTPHPKEFGRLAGNTTTGFDRYALQKEFSIKNKVYVVLKGAHTSVSCPDGTVYFNSTGNPGMATAGSGDVLTGIITGLLAQAYSPKDACMLGVYLHGLAGDIAAKKLSEEAMVAGDIIDNIGAAYLEIKA